ncbi:MAG: AMP-binding protein, partial [Pseudomonadota bacterium]
MIQAAQRGEGGSLVGLPQRALTHAEHMIWTGQALRPDVPLYNMAWAFRIEGPLDGARFQRAFSQVVAISDSLRTTYRDVDGTAIAFLRDELRATVELVDFSANNSADLQAQDWMQARVCQHLAIEQQTFDTALLRLSAGTHIWYFNQHHIASDAWSGSVLLNAVGQAYLEEGDKASAPIPDFSNYAASLAAPGTEPNPSAATDWWQGRTQTAAPLPKFYGKPATGAHPSTRRLTRPLGADREAALAALGEQEGFRSFSPHLTRFTIFASVYAAWAARVSGQECIRIAAPAHNRPSLTLRQALGLFIELFPMEMTLAEGETFRTLYRKMANEGQSFLKYAQPGLSTAKGVASANLVLNYISARFGDFAGMPVSVTWLHPGCGDPAHLVRLQVHAFDDQETVLAFDVNDAIFNEEEHAALADHVFALLDAFLANPDQAIDTVPLTAPTGHACLSAPPAECTTPATVLAGFKEQVALRPQALAIDAGDEQVTYADLEARSDAIAAGLLVSGAPPNTPIGLYLHRSPQFLAALLGIWKAGAAFLPLEARLPAARVATLLNEAGAHGVIVDRETSDNAKGFSGTIFSVDALSGTHTKAQLPVINGTDLAYCLYTSGSTGKPKAVAVDHGALVDYVAWAARSYAPEAPCTMPFYTSVSFDLTLTSLFLPLLTGGSIRVYREPPSGPDLTVLDVFTDDQVDMVKLTPSHLNLVVQQAPMIKRIDRLILGGEALSTETCRKAQ